MWNLSQMFTFLPSLLRCYMRFSWEAQFRIQEWKIPRGHGSKKLHLLLIRSRLMRCHVIHQWWWPGRLIAWWIRFLAGFASSHRRFLHSEGQTAYAGISWWPFRRTLADAEKFRWALLERNKKLASLAKQLKRKQNYDSAKNDDGRMNTCVNQKPNLSRVEKIWAKRWQKMPLWDFAVCHFH